MSGQTQGGHCMDTLKQGFRYSVMAFGMAAMIGTALIAAPVTVTAASQTQDKAPMDDSWITAKTKIALFADSRVKVRQINVETKNGLVMMRGKVDTNEAKNAAE